MARKQDSSKRILRERCRKYRAGRSRSVWLAKPCLVPPKCDATCLVHLNRVSKAHDHATAMCG